MTAIQSVAFDLEGTVIDVEYAHHQAFIRSAEELGMFLSMEDCFRQLPHFVGGPDDEVAKDISKLSVSLLGKELDYQTILERKRVQYPLLLDNLVIAPRKGFVKAFNKLKSMGLPCAIGSLTHEEQARHLLEKSGLAALVGYETIVLREHVQRLKPAPDVWIETARRMSVSPDTQLVFEDSPRGITGALTIGAYCVGMPIYNRVDTVTALISAGAKRVFMQWDEMNPAALIHNINCERSSAGL